MTRPSGKHSDTYLETLRCIVAELGPQRFFHASLRRILDILAQRHAFFRPHMVIFDPEARTLRLCMAGTPPTTEGLVYEPGVGVTGQVFTLGQTVIVERIGDNPVFQNKFFIRTEQEMAQLAFLCLPVFAPREQPSEEREVLGTLSLDTPTAPREALEEACRFLEVVAELIGNQVAYFQHEMCQHGRAAMGSMGAVFAEASSIVNVIAMSKIMQQTVEQIVQAGATRTHVLLRGEAGTGKELLAEVLHKNSARRHMPLLHINCASLLTDDLARLDQWFFGLQKGSIPSAVQSHKGILEECHQGTLFLNTIECLPPSIQAALLRVLRNQEVLRVGGNRPLPVNVRVISSTRKSVGDLQEKHGINAELLQVLSGLEIYIPPLRERREDIVPLAEHFLQIAATTQGRNVRRLAGEVVKRLLQHPWFGNARELRHCMERAISHGHGASIGLEDLPPSLQTESPAQQSALNFVDAVACYEQSLLADALSKARGNMLETSRILSTSYRIINYKVKKYGLDPKQYM